MVKLGITHTESRIHWKIMENVSTESSRDTIKVNTVPLPASFSSDRSEPDPFLNTSNPAFDSPGVYDSLLFEADTPTSPSTPIDSKQACPSHRAQSPMSGSGVGDNNASGRASESGRRSSSQRTTAPSHPQNRQQQGRSSVSGTAPPYYTPSPTDAYHGPSRASPSHPPPQYSQAVGSYPQGSGFTGPYTHPVQNPMPIASAQPQYPYSHGMHHPSIHAHDPSAGSQYSTMPYGSASFGPPVHARGPMYPQYQRYSPEGAPTATPPFPGISNPSSTGSSSPGSPHSTHPSAPPGAFSGPMSTPTYPSLHYTSMTPPQPYGSYHPDSFSHANQSLYPSQYPGHYPSYMPPHNPEENRGQTGTWWYLPSSPVANTPGQSPYDQRRSYQDFYQMGFPPGPPPEHDAYGNPTPSQSYTASQLPTPSNRPNSMVAAGSSSTSVSSPRPPLLLPSSSSGGQSSSSSASGGSGPAASPSGRTPMRQSYHPNPPPNRSEWVMWCGNVPSDATNQEVWDFFNQTPSAFSTSSVIAQAHLPAGLLSPADTENPNDPNIWGGVASVFLISRSNCAFINFLTEAHLNSAVQRFNGVPLRPHNPRCPRLVCRVRRKDDDLKAGVGAQRGLGMHSKWIKEQKQRAARASAASSSHSEEPPDSPLTYTDPESGLSPTASSSRGTASEDELRVSLSPSGRSPAHHSSSSGSYASTTSSLLTRHFPQRYFILKSLTEYDLNLSVEKGVWATQLHNEGILNQAFRTSKDVFLIFGANKSGEFFGYARMAGPITKSDEKPSWAPREGPSGSGSRVSSIPEEDARTPGASGPGAEREILFLPGEHRLAEESPAPLTPGTIAELERSSSQGGPSRSPLQRSPSSHPDASRPITETKISAPTELFQPYRRISRPEQQQPAHTYDDQVRQTRTIAFELDSEAPSRRAHQVRSSTSLQAVDEDGVKRRDTLSSPVTDRSPFDERDTRDGDGTWGTPFKIQWIKTERLPFLRTKHLRNPWNHDREVKVSRDGTELEPGVGQALLDEWDKPEPAQPQPPTSPSTSRRGAGTRGRPVSAPASSQNPQPRRQAEGNTQQARDGQGPS